MVLGRSEMSIGRKPRGRSAARGGAKAQVADPVGRPRAGTAGAGGNACPVEYQTVGKVFRSPGGTLRTLQAVTFAAVPGGITSIIGPSGCGKTTLLRIAAGLESASEGSVLIDGHLVASIDDARSRGVGFVTQDAKLLPWLTVLDNVALPLKIAGMRKAERTERAMAWIANVGLGSFEKFYPAQLSGGMQKRCSVARAMAYEPRVLLLDEPFGALDAMTRLTLQNLLLELLQRVSGITGILVTHDLSEALALGKQVVAITGRPGRVRTVMRVDLGDHRDVYDIAAHPNFGSLQQELWNVIRGTMDPAAPKTS
jgi:NitT/TauT family transport system ATP-binding protein